MFRGEVVNAAPLPSPLAGEGPGERGRFCAEDTTHRSRPCSMVVIMIMAVSVGMGMPLLRTAAIGSRFGFEGGFDHFDR